MRNLKSFAIAAVVCALVTGSLSAQTATGLVQWAGVSGAWSSYSNTNTGGLSSAQWNVYTSPYKAQFMIPGNTEPSPLLPPSGVSTFGPVSDIFCVDFNHYANTSANGGYDAYFTNLGSSSAGDISQYTRTGNLDLYLAAAYLSQEIEAYGAFSATAGDINGAMWQIMWGSPQYRWNGTAWDDAGITSWVNTALTTGWQTVNASDWVVVTDENAAGQGVLGGGNQEYIAQVQVTPEPATLLLLGTGLLGLVVAASALRRLSA